MFRYAILSAVSTPKQAKLTSLDDQIDICRKHASEKGWRETAGPFTIPGNSRTKYLNLSDAEREMPPLRDLLETAKRGAYDILVVYDHDRLRDLLMLVYSALSDYRVQLYSYALPADPVPPEQYDPYENDMAEMLIGLSTIKSRGEIARMRRKYRTGMRNRITVYGIPVQIPFGYRKPLNQTYHRKAIPEPIPELAPHLIHIKDMILRKESIQRAIAYLVENNVAPPRGEKWYPITVRDMLRNPFYAGFVRFEISKVKRDRRLNKKTRDRHIPEEDQTIAPGKHTPLWDEKTYHALISELKTRSKHFPPRQVYALTSLLKCGACGALMWRQKNGPRATADRAIWRCSQALSKHPGIVEKDFLPNFYHTLAQQIIGTLKSPAAIELSPAKKSLKLEDLTAQRRRLETAYLRGLFSVDIFEQRARELDRQITEETQKTSDKRAAAMRREQRLAYIKQLPPTPRSLIHLFTNSTPEEINKILSTLIEYVTIHPGEKFEIHWRD